MSDQQEQNQISSEAVDSPANPAVSHSSSETPGRNVSDEPRPREAAEAQETASDAAPADETPAKGEPPAESKAATPSEDKAEEAPVKSKRSRRTVKKTSGDDEGEEAEPKPRARRATRGKRVANPSTAPVSDEVAQARALAQISQAQVVRAQRQAAEREAAALSELVTEADHAASVETAAAESPADSTAEPTRTVRPRKRSAKKHVASAADEADETSANEGRTPDSETPIVDPSLRPHRRGRKPKAYIEAEKAAAAALAAQQAAQEEPANGASVHEVAPSENSDGLAHEDVRPGRGRRAAAKRSAKNGNEETAESKPGEAPSSEESADQPEKPKRSRRKKKSDQATEADGAASEAPEVAKDKADKQDDAENAEKSGKSDEASRQNRRQHKRDRSDDRGDHRDDRNDRRQRQRDRKQRNKDRYNTPTEPSLSREELSAMKVAELREKAKEFEIETTGKKKAELVEEIYTTAAKLEGFRDITGILEIANEGYGHIHAHGYMPSRDDAFVPANMIRAARLRSGDVIEGTLRPSRANDKFPGLSKIKTINGLDPEEARKRPKFSDLTPIYPNELLRMEHGKDSITGRAIDIVSPIGKGQRGLIVSPPKAGKTTILKKICQSISINNPEVHLICLLVDERPEEVTDMQRSIKGEVVASTFDMPADNHTRVSELVIERAKRIVELGGDVVVVLDSITRLARAYNLAAPASGRILSGGVDSAALYPPKRFLGAARNIENGGSLTILASALVDTGSKMDEVIFEEFKGTGNMELKLDRDLADRRIFPAIDPVASGTRNEDLLVDEQMRPFVFGLRRILAGMNNTERAAASFIKGLKGTDNNQEFLVRTAKKANEHEAQY